jgi:ribosomal-protein-alanine N-acetyltransferase
LLRAGFAGLGLDVIEAGARLDNAASFAVMRACGMAEAGPRMVHAVARGGPEPCFYYQMLNPATGQTGPI